MLFCEWPPFTNPDLPSVHRVFRGRQHVHLMSDDEGELLRYAAEIGMNLCWIQRDHLGFPHFDVTGRRLRFVEQDSRVEKLPWREFLDRSNALRAKRVPDGH